MLLFPHFSVKEFSNTFGFLICVQYVSLKVKDISLLNQDL